ncbi:hypothetical protein [Streptomyces europaeiscabiei]|nr:hypothetical protein [Streptomyces europaeiscabiei]MDX2758401.1 hypothetical protein [Streptomyces europaeiscabiei]
MQQWQDVLYVLSATTAFAAALTDLVSAVINRRAAARRRPTDSAED